jgi:hypothetical protein
MFGRTKGGANVVDPGGSRSIGVVGRTLAGSADVDEEVRDLFAALGG